MAYIIKNNTYKIDNNIKDDYQRRKAFNALALETFGLSFEEWYQAGYWTNAYQPYVLLQGEELAANVSVSVIHTKWQGQEKTFVQLGTVMTASKYRNLGLSKFLISHVLQEWTHKSDMIYLYANDSVLDFYPRFGFVQEIEYQASLFVPLKSAVVSKLMMSNPDHVLLLKKYYQKGNPFSALPMLNCWGLLMFYCFSSMKDCIYYLGDFSCIIIGEDDGGTLTVFDIFGGHGFTLIDILGAVSKKEKRLIRLGFAPKNLSLATLSPLKQKDTTLFVLKGKENIFKDSKTMLPLLSHA